MFTMNENAISCLILQELKLIREEMKEEIRRLCKSIEFFHFDKTSEKVFDSNQDFPSTPKNSMHFTNNLTNHNNDVLVKDELIPDSTVSLTKCESNFCGDQFEFSSSENVGFGNLEVGTQFADIKLDAENDKSVVVKEIIEQENILCTTAKHETLPSQPVIVDVKSLYESKSAFTYKKNDSEIFVKPTGYPILDKNNISHSSSIVLNANNRNLLSGVDHLDKRKRNDYIFSNKTFPKNSKSKVNMRPHAGENQHKCDICNKSFSKRSILILHYRTHTGEKPFKCNLCDKRFRSNSRLREHIRIHTGEGLYECNICNKRFLQKTDLVRHTRIHTGEKPFKCNICNKSFRQNSVLAEHILIHTGEKPHKCNICGKRFTQSSNLTRHIRTHTGEKPYKCNICNRSFSQSSNLIKHANTHTK